MPVLDTDKKARLIAERDRLNRPLPKYEVQAVYSDLTVFQPTAERPWARRSASHMLRRTGYGSPLAEVDELLTMTPEQAADFLVDQAVNTPLPEEVPQWFIDQDPDYTAFANFRWDWLDRMVEYPVFEKLTFIWHDHFAVEHSSHGQTSATWRYLTCLRRNALGNFRTFVDEIGKLDAMLFYLNGYQNNKDSPNENYARELCELFTMGLDNYTQEDITQLARALSGWTYNWQDWAPDPFLSEDLFDAGDDKTIFGQTGAWGYDDVIDLIFSQRGRETAEFVCGKLYSWYINTTLDPVYIGHLADLFQASGYVIEPVLRAMFKSDHFFDESFIGAKIKDPIDIVIGGFRTLDRTLDISPDPRSHWLWRYLYAQGSGLELFEPQNVSGFRLDRDTLSTLTLPLRWRYASHLVSGYGAASPMDFVDMAKALTPDQGNGRETCRTFAAFLMGRTPEDDAFETYWTVFKGDIPEGEFENGLWDLDRSEAPDQLRNLATFLGLVPEAQLG